MYSGQGGMPLERNAMQTVLDGWIERCQRSNQSDKESAADCRLVIKSVGHGDETYADVSSAKRVVSHKGAADTMSLTYIENISGLRMAPCGTPALISIDDEDMIFSEHDSTLKTFLSLSLRTVPLPPGVEEGLTYTSTTGKDNAGRPPSYRR